MEIFDKWLKELADDLTGISSEDREAILESYREQINEMRSCGSEEADILAKIGSPKKVAKEILESFTDDGDLEQGGRVWESSSPTGHRSKQIVVIAGIAVCLLISLASLVVMTRLVIGGLFISLLSIGLMIALFFTALLAFNVALASGYIGFLVWNLGKGKRVKKKGIEKYLMVSSVVAIMVGGAVFVGSICTNPLLKQGVIEGELFDLIEEKSQGILEFDDVFEFDFS